MDRLRRLVLRNRSFAVAVIALALAMKLLLPTGFMPIVSNGQIVVGVCSENGPAAMVVTLPRAERDGSGDHDRSGKPDAPCAYSGLSAPALSAADSVLLAMAILVVMAMGVRAIAATTLAARPFLRPPLRAPPATA